MDLSENRERFIPLQKSELVRLLLEEGGLNPSEQEKFGAFCRLLESIYHFEFHKKLEFLKNNYFPFNPDRSDRTKGSFSSEHLHECERNLISTFKEILNNANFEQISQKDIAFAIEKESLFKINLFVDFDDFENQLIFRRGLRSDKVEIKKWFFKKSKVDIPVFDRVALLIKFKDEAYFKEKTRKVLNFTPGSMIVKLFKNIPRADMEMLFPNTQVRMKPKDIIMIGGCAIGGGVAVLLKASAGLIAIVTVLWFMAGSFIRSGGALPDLGPAEISAMVGGITAIAAIGAFIFKQWNSYKNRKIQFMKVLGDNLYFKNLDNNAGVFYHIIDDAEEEEFKEALLSYYFLYRCKNGMTSADLDAAIERWLEEKHGVNIDFEISDAVRKLKELALCRIAARNSKEEEIWQAVELDDALKKLDYMWDNYFQFNQPVMKSL